MKLSEMGTTGLVSYVRGEKQGADYIKSRQRMGAAKRVLRKRGYGDEQITRFENAVKAA